MDLQVVYLNNKSVFPSISSYEEFIEEVKKLEPYSQDIAVSYVDEEGDEIQVSNSSDLVAIVDTKSVVLRLDIKIDEDKKKKDEARKLKVKQEQRAKRLEALQSVSFLKNINPQQKIHKLHELIAEDQNSLDRLKQDAQSDLENLNKQLQEAVDWKPQELPDILELIAKDGIIEKIKDKENQLILCDGKKEFNTQLKTITQEIHALFHGVYAQRALQINGNYIQAKEKQALQEKLLKEIETQKKKSVDHITKMQEKVAIHQSELEQKKKELEQIEQ